MIKWKAFCLSALIFCLAGCTANKKAIELSSKLETETQNARKLSQELSENHTAAFDALNNAYRFAQAVRLAERRVAVAQIASISQQCAHQLDEMYAAAQKDLYAQSNERFLNLIKRLDEIAEPLHTLTVQREGAALRAQQLYEENPGNDNFEQDYNETGIAYIKAAALLLDNTDRRGIETVYEFTLLQNKGLKELKEEHKRAAQGDTVAPGKCERVRREYVAKADSRIPALPDQTFTPPELQEGYNALGEYFAAVEKSAGDMKSFHEVWGFGKNSLLSSVVTTVPDTLVDKIKAIAPPALAPLFDTQTGPIAALTNEASEEVTEFIADQAERFNNIVNNVLSEIDDEAKETAENAEEEIENTQIDAKSGPARGKQP